MTIDHSARQAALRELPDRQLARRLGQAFNAQAKVEAAARPSTVRIGEARVVAAELRVELGSRILDGRWSAWDAIGVEAAPGDRRQNGDGTIWHDRQRGRFVAEITVDGRRGRKVCRTRAEASAWLRDAGGRAREGRDAREVRWTVAEWLDHLCNEVWPREGLKPEDGRQPSRRD